VTHEGAAHNAASVHFVPSITRFIEVHCVIIIVQDLTVTIMSERLEREVELENDDKQPSTINVESFVDEQEWRLYQEVETFHGVVNKFYEGDATEMNAHPSFSCRTHASRRPGFYITNIFVVMVTVSAFCV